MDAGVAGHEIRLFSIFSRLASDTALQRAEPPPASKTPPPDSAGAGLMKLAHSGSLLAH
jgi:hypothetical protein